MLLLLLLFSIGARPQNPNFIFRHLTTDNGLISNSVTAIFQDSGGYIWIATQNGLQRYDGYRFVTYQADLHNPDALQTDWVSTVFEDSRHRLWIGADKEGPYLLDRNTGKFYNYNLHAGQNGVQITSTWKFIEDGNREIWLLGKEGYYKLNETTNQFDNYSPLFGLVPGISPGNFVADKNGSLWVVTSAGMKYYDRTTKKVYDRGTDAGKLALFTIKEPPANVFVDAENDIWVSSSIPELLYKYNPALNHLKSYCLLSVSGKSAREKEPARQIGNMGKAYNGSVLAAITARGLALYNPLKDNFSFIGMDNGDPFAFHCNPKTVAYVCMMTDREGNTWIGGDKGINIFNPSRQHFAYHSSMDNGINGETLPPYSVSGLIQTPADGDIYVSYDYDNVHSGIYRLDSSLRIKKHYFMPAQAGKSNPLNQITYLSQDDKGIIWAPTRNNTILKLDIDRGTLVNTTNNSLKGYINCIKKSDQGAVWIGHWSKGLIKIDPHTHVNYSFTSPPPGISSPVKNVACLSFDGDSLIWAGTYDQGLLCFDMRTNKFTTTYQFDEKDKESISDNIVTSISALNSDTLLLSTTTGINIFDKKKKTFYTISGKDGLPGNFVQAIAPDKKGNLWAGCVDGFCKVDIRTKVVTNYGISDGIVDNGFNSTPMLHLKDGRYLVAGVKGLMVFNPEQVDEKTAPPDVSLTGFKTLTREIPTDSFIQAKQPIELSYKENSIRIQFASLQFSSPGKIKYYYQLEGADKNWILADKDQAASYNQLNTNNYLFKVKCIGRDGIPSNKITLLAIHIIPPFWMTWWFYLILGSLATIVIIAASIWYIDRAHEKETLKLNYERKIAAVELNTLRAQMNPHFIFNSLNSINTFILKNDQDNATDYLSKFSQLVRLILDNSRTDWVLLQNELKALELYIELESLRVNDTFAYTINTGPEVMVSSVIVPPLIIQPYVENAIWHGLSHRKKSGSKLAVSIWKENNKLMIQVEDNGIGRKAAANIRKKKIELHKSHGMKITEERLAIVNEVYRVEADVVVTDLHDASTGENGTRILLTIQYKTHADINY